MGMSCGIPGCCRFLKRDSRCLTVTHVAIAACGRHERETRIQQENQAASDIQRRVRGRRGRQQYEQMREHQRAEARRHHRAASSIQARQRGRMARRQLEEEGRAAEQIQVRDKCGDIPRGSLPVILLFDCSLGTVPAAFCDKSVHTVVSAFLYRVR